MSVPSKVSSKRSEMYAVFGCTVPWNFVTFELESGERKEFRVLDDDSGTSDYGLLIEQDTGILSCKEKRWERQKMLLYEGFQRQIARN